ncbi:Neutral sphingomyelinase [Paragonimus skrjabini miyazakii]|uniref:Neutral sphingomyelinase n=2 Tax=Paragonimus TaxID=34503 RepID=A0A8J4SI92_9TREM|nr:Neutral sphingomyelinase [Paragonimus heterotremus]KAF7260990.1 Neutral sphingomyelinase [Paragonimus skrjabini miyazakii]
MLIQVRQLATTLLGLSIGLVICGLATSQWSCGNLFDNCQRGQYKSAVIAVIALLLLGLVCLMIVLILDTIAFCSDQFSVTSGYVTTRFVFLYLGAASLFVGILLYTGQIGHAWSYFCATVGCVFALQVAILAILSSKCVTTHERVTVRTVRA